MSAHVPTREQLRDHPQLATLLALSRQIELLEPVLAAIHGDGDPTASCEQARSLLRVARILQHQVDAYRGLLALPERPAKLSPTKTSARARR